MTSLENLLQLVRAFQDKEISVPVFIEDFQEMYFNERLFEQIPENIQAPMDNIVLAVGLTNIDEDERDPFGGQLDEDGLRHALHENMTLIEETLR